MPPGSRPHTNRAAPTWRRPKFMSGSVLLSQGATTQVPSALAGLTSVFGMGTGGSPPLSPPDNSRVFVPGSIRSLPHAAPVEGTITSIGTCSQVLASRHGCGGPRPRRRCEATPRALHSEHECLNSISSPRPISTGQLNTLLCLHFRPINLVFCQGPYPVNPVGDLILRWVSYLDAFSAYPVRT